jgi:hypothetical protein
MIDEQDWKTHRSTLREWLTLADAVARKAVSSTEGDQYRAALSKLYRKPLSMVALTQEVQLLLESYIFSITDILEWHHTVCLCNPLAREGLTVPERFIVYVEPEEPETYECTLDDMLIDEMIEQIWQIKEES